MSAVKEMLASVDDALIALAIAFPGQASPLLLHFTLKGDVFGRSVEKGLTKSCWFGAFPDLEDGVVADRLLALIEDGTLGKLPGFYPGVYAIGHEPYGWRTELKEAARAAENR